MIKQLPEDEILCVGKNINPEAISIMWQSLSQVIEILNNILECEDNDE